LTNRRERLRDRLTAGVTGGAPLYPLVVLFGLNAVDELDRSALNVLTPEIRDHFGLSLSGVLALVALVEVGAIVLGLPLAFWADRKSRVRIATGGAALWGGFSLLTGLAPSLFVLAVARAGAGMGRAVNTPTHFSLLADYYPTTVRSKVYGVHRSANSTGQILGPVVGGVLALFLGWRAPFVLFAVPTAVFVVLALRLREPARGAEERRALGATEDVALTEETAPRFGEGVRLLWGVRSLRRIWYSLPFVAGVIFVGLGALFSIFYEEEFGLNEAQRGLVSAVTEPFQILGLLIGIPVANKLMRRDPALVLRLLAVMGVVISSAFAGLAVAPTLPVVIGLHLFISGVGAVLQPGAYALVSLVTPPRARSLGFALGAVWVLPGLVAFPVIGAVADSYGVRRALLVLVPLLLIGGFILASAGKFINADIVRTRTASLARSEALLARRRGESKLLVVRGLDVAYDSTQVLFGVDFEVGEGEIVALLGTNGAGKSTLLRAISGVVEPTAGVVVLDGVDLTGVAPHHVAGLGVAHVPGGKGVFPSLTVAENLRVATWGQRLRGAAAEAAAGEAMAHFPMLRLRLDQPAGTLSGGEQQMLALAQAFVARPRLLLVDELSLGLAPAVVSRLLDVIRAIRDRGTTVVLVEQSVTTALALADVAYFMEKGEIRFRGPSAELAERPDLLRAVFLRAAVGSGHPASASGDTPHPGAVASIHDRPALEVEGLTKRFGAVVALDDVSLAVPPGRILGIIGPNGAGKTTLFDAISGFLLLDGGRIRLDGQDITRRGPDQRARLGLGRSFQDARLFPSLTVVEAVGLALERTVEVRDPLATALGLRAVARSEKCVAGRVSEIIDRMGLGAYADSFVSELSTGTRRLVDLACVLAHEPTVLLLDEPSSGIAQREAEALGPVLVDIRDQTGAALVVIEHDLPLVSSIAEEMVALDLGRVLARGSPDEVLADPQVTAAYMGAPRA
jgi:ABC-type branched-subunit amino acid transport system ATPase component/predicted MFS family arabinose efflux permease